jgi:hypothetical protein
MVNSGCRDGLTAIWKFDPTGNRNVVAGTLHSHASNPSLPPGDGVGNLHIADWLNNQFNYDAEISDSRGPRGHAREGCQPPRAPLRDCRKRRWGAAAVEEASKLTPGLLILDVSLFILDGPNGAPV